jgi:pilus assembly protein CpaF
MFGKKKPSGGEQPPVDTAQYPTPPTSQPPAQVPPQMPEASVPPQQMPPQAPEAQVPPQPPMPPQMPEPQAPPQMPAQPSSEAPPAAAQEAALPAVTQQPSERDGALTVKQEQMLAEQQSLLNQRKALAQAAKNKKATYKDASQETPDFIRAKRAVSEELLERLDFDKLSAMPEADKRQMILDIGQELIARISLPLTSAQNELLKKQLLDDVLGFGPLEILLDDPEVSDIMVNTAEQVYIERAGKISMTDVTFDSERHLLNVIQKIVQRVGRRVDETSPMVDARMPDGSRFNAIIPPLALDGSLVSIRKFKQNKMPLTQYLDYGSASPEMVRFLEICGKIRLNIMISGGTGSGKTTLLNALSGHISEDERVITIEDAAELQMHQPHVLRLETRPPNMEGVGEITQRALVKNALRMRPDRIILGEIRGEEVIDVLQAMNTGHDGSMATVHANNPRECLTRLENLFGMSGMTLPLSTLRGQIASSLNMIVQIGRLRDGSRKITHIEEVVGMEGDIVVTQTLFHYKPTGMGEDGKLQGQFICNGVKPRFIEQADYYGLAQEMSATLAGSAGMA